jgi:CheY-like chemotaxis protein
LSNAVKFTPRGGTITVRLARSGPWIEITVADTGIGFAPESLSYIFDRFRQGDGSITRRFGGLGLGLALVRQLVGLHGGSVSASSEGEGRGACFTIRLPVQTERAAPSLVPLTAAPQAQSSAELAGLCVLVVDDEPDARDLLLYVLADNGAEVVVAHDAQAALDSLAQRMPDVLVSDIGMPGVDGYELLRRVRSQGITVPAIALTAFARAEDRIRALRAGYRAHVAKPVEPAEIVATIASVIGR